MKINLKSKDKRIYASFCNLHASSRIQNKCAFMWLVWLRICIKFILSSIKSSAIVKRGITMNKTKIHKESSLRSQWQKIKQPSWIEHSQTSKNGNWSTRMSTTENMKTCWNGIRNKCNCFTMLKKNSALSMLLESKCTCIQSSIKKRNACASGESTKWWMARRN